MGRLDQLKCRKSVLGLVPASQPCLSFIPKSMKEAVEEELTDGQYIKDGDIMWSISL